MTRYAWIALAVWATTAPAQVNLKLRLAHDTVLHMEPVVASLTIENGTEEELVIGETNGNTRLFFDIEVNPGTPVARTEAPLFRRPAVVPPFKSATLEFNLLPLYQIRTAGAYSVRARVHGPAGLSTSSREFLDVVPGMAVANMVKPGPGDTRYLYQLRTIARDREEHLFLRVDDEANHLCHGVFDLGSMLRVLDPVMRRDGHGRVHVLHQSSPTRFTHSVFEADGEPVSSTFWSGRPAEVALQMTEDGDIVVAGASPYRGDRMVAPPTVDSRRIDEMKKKEGAESRFAPSKPFFRWGLPAEESATPSKR